MKPILHALNITKSYGSQQVLSNLSVPFNQNEFVSLVGPSGSGKTTLLAILATLDRPDSGTLLLHEENLLELDRHEIADVRNRYFGFVFQSANMIMHLNVLENILLPTTYSQHLQDSNALESRASNLLESVGLKGYARKDVSTLSGGEQQRVAIARALIHNPEIIFADEPTGNLDGKNTDIVLGILKEFATQNKTVIMVTHDLHSANQTHRIIDLAK